MNIKIIISFILLAWSVVINADTSDYIWNEQFSKKIAEATAGKTRSQYDVGNMYLKGQGTGIDESKAFEWFSKAAKSGHVKSQFKLGLMLLNGRGVKKDYAKAEKWLRIAANKKNASAQYYLAGMYRDGKFLTKNYDKALFWLKKAKANGFWKAANEYDKVISMAQRNNSRAPEPSQSISEPKPRRVSKPKPRPVVRTKPAVSNDLRDLILNSQWLERGKPSKYLPSALTQCKKKLAGIYCASKKDFKGKRGNTQFTYRIVVSIKNIAEAGEFSATYRNDVLTVVPGKPVVIPGEDGEEDITRPSPLIDKGLQRTVHSLECQLDNVKQISCVKDLSRSIKLTRK